MKDKKTTRESVFDRMLSDQKRWKEKKEKEELPPPKPKRVVVVKKR